ncbi:ABC transporter substrate-binding protein [Marinovum sp. SP66]|uniref:ABC transporter substrate-binding protein n=1 Tax=Marinovum TaxID=367771 RepID=UPI00237B5D32|nr:ABC transporter substrate-binding protein [Marinovum sp. SP66]MDD9739861.1 ABC transporter substrate-binding protein [Marinovum sp. SP66]
MTTHIRLGLYGAAALAVATTTTMAQDAPAIELLHWWDGASGEAVQTMRGLFEEKGGTWKDTTVSGEGASAMATLRARALAGNPPGAVVLKGPDIQEWGSHGFLRDINAIAETEGWNDLLAPTIQGAMQYDGAYVAFPVTVHRNNWMYTSVKALDAVGAEPPTTWEEFNAVATKMQDAGIIPVALGGQKWQEITLFEAVGLGMGVDWYRDAFVNLDDTALNAPEMQATLEQLRTMMGWVDSASPGRDYEQTAAMMLAGEAGFQFMGDWELGALAQQDAEVGVDFLCLVTPSNQGDPAFLLNADSIALFNTEDANELAGQESFARIGMSETFQTAFNKVKGSIPPRSDIDLADFHTCQQKSAEDLVAASDAGNVVLSMGHSMAVPGNVRGAIMDAVSEYMNTDMSPEDGAEAIRTAIEITR